MSGAQTINISFVPPELRPISENDPPYKKEHIHLTCENPPAKAFELFAGQPEIFVYFVISNHILLSHNDARLSIVRACIGSQRVVMKNFWNRNADLLELPVVVQKEADRYEELRSLQGTVIPTFYGVFEGVDQYGCKFASIILEDCGEPFFRRLSEMDEECYEPFFEKLHKLHQSGYRIPMKNGRNVVEKRDNTLRFISVLEFKRHENCKWDGKLYVGEVRPPPEELGCPVIARIFDKWDIGLTEPVIFIHGECWGGEKNHFPRQKIVDILAGQGSDYIHYKGNIGQMWDWLQEYQWYEDDHPNCTIDEFKRDCGEPNWDFKTWADVIEDKKSSNKSST